MAPRMGRGNPEGGDTVIIDIRDPLKRRAAVVALALPALVLTLIREVWLASVPVFKEFPGAIRDAWRGR